MIYFQTRFLEEANKFIAGLDAKVATKLLYTIDLAQQLNDPKLFKKMTDEIWEFRLRYANTHIRLLAFWDKSDTANVLVFATHGFVKKTDKVPHKEIDRAKTIRKKYFDSKK